MYDQIEKLKMKVERIRSETELRRMEMKAKQKIMSEQVQVKLAVRVAQEGMSSE